MFTETVLDFREDMQGRIQDKLVNMPQFFIEWRYATTHRTFFIPLRLTLGFKGSNGCMGITLARTD